MQKISRRAILSILLLCVRSDEMCTNYCTQPDACKWTEKYRCPWQKSWVPSIKGVKVAEPQTFHDVGYDCCCVRRYGESMKCGGSTDGKKITVFYIRHGQAHHNVLKIKFPEFYKVPGKDHLATCYDAELTNEGMYDALGIGEESEKGKLWKLSGEGLVVASSPMKRACATTVIALKSQQWAKKVYILPMFEERKGANEFGVPHPSNCAHANDFSIQDPCHIWPVKREIESVEDAGKPLSAYLAQIDVEFGTVDIVYDDLARTRYENQKKKIQDRFDLSMEYLLRHEPDMDTLVIGGHGDIYRIFINEMLQYRFPYHLRFGAVVQFSVEKSKIDGKWKIVTPN